MATVFLTIRHKDHTEVDMLCDDFVAGDGSVCDFFKRFGDTTTALEAPHKKTGDAVEVVLYEHAGNNHATLFRNLEAHGFILAIEKFYPKEVAPAGGAVSQESDHELACGCCVCLPCKEAKNEHCECKVVVSNKCATCATMTEELGTNTCTYCDKSYCEECNGCGHTAGGIVFCWDCVKDGLALLKAKREADK